MNAVIKGLFLACLYLAATGSFDWTKADNTVNRGTSCPVALIVPINSENTHHIFLRSLTLNTSHSSTSPHPTISHSIQAVPSSVKPVKNLSFLQANYVQESSQISNKQYIVYYQL